ncbi:hypothetical protein K2173_018121 [Erythroxylum novogranatense]|uniref:GUN4-like domain-containing protein n=1 Tax=Erythroxylum novogranatense TaxID=1862640 RepID=A0AAV8U696_9ROSI|nr:hypothetical protein K2173_018121 [Erythroxylum novogranatense]
MATNSLNSLLHHKHSLLKLQPSESTLPSSNSFFLKPTTSISSSTSTSHLSISIPSSSSESRPSAVFSATSATSAAPSSPQTFSLDLLSQYLSDQNFRQADEETRRLLIVLAGEAAQKRGYVFFSEVKFIPDKDLKAIDELWRKHSNNRFGYSVQKRTWMKKANKDFTQLFIKVGWMKKLDTEVEQYNYRAFPDEFMWELNSDTPEGHLPLTNALRGTQLLNNILNHPAFEAEEEEEEEEDKAAGESEGLKGLADTSKTLRNRVMKTDYSF